MPTNICHNQSKRAVIILYEVEDIPANDLRRAAESSQLQTRYVGNLAG